MIGKIFKKKYEDIDNPLISELNENQKVAVLNDSKRLLVLAGAGSGKTKTLIKKIIYLIFKKNVSPSNILAITFTKNAANEMIDRLIQVADKNKEYSKIINNKKLSNKQKEAERRKYIRTYPWLSNITVKTFHSFCYNMLKNFGSKVFDNKFRILIDYSRDEEIDLQRQAKERPEEIMKKMIIEACEDVEFLIKLKRYILDYYVDEYRLKMHSKGFTNYQKPYTTLNGENVASKSERDIADWLYRHNIEYEYEPLISPGSFEFQPDFFIKEANLYLEHVSNLSYSLKDKQKAMKESGKKYEEIQEKDMQDSTHFNKKMDYLITSHLDRDFKKASPLKVTEEFKGYEKYLRQFILDLVRAIDKIKVENRKFDEIYKKSQEDEHLRVREFYQLAKPILESYKKYCIDHSYLDFNDLMIETVRLLKQDSAIRKKFQEKFRYLLVDEFQDVNTLQVRLINYLLTEENQLFCVGDDWQSIYGWRGSEVEYIVNFKQFFKRPLPEIIKLKINYRSNNTIVNASNEVIKNNKYKIKKEISSFNQEGKKIFLHCAKKESEDGVETVVENINKLLQNGYQKEDIMVLSRTRKSEAYENYHLALRKLGIRIYTMHQAKGLEAKAVFIIGLTNGFYGFPNVRDADRIFQIIKKSNYELLMEEERRLFYVALTRAREELFLVSEVGNESEFLNEIPGEFLDRKNFLILNIEKTKKITCKFCNKELNGEFNYCPYCGEDKKKNITLIKEDNSEKKVEKDASKSSGKIQFNEDGSIKLPEHILKSKQMEKESIVLRRVQINRNNPAIAHLRIEFPDDVSNQKEILDYYEEIRDKRFPSVDHAIKKVDKRTFIIEVKNGTKYMYSLLDYLLECFEFKFKQNKSVIVRGNWDKFDSN
jgi:DNA helicase-4|tara:strand:+ start:130 stop:2772 length:2643 start_codon:yes stop_codon:yes gene_type:complete